VGCGWLPTTAYEPVRDQGTCGPAVWVQSHSHSGVRSMPPCELPPVTEPDGALSTPPSKVPCGPLGETHGRHALAAHIASLLACGAFRDAQATPGPVARGGAAPGFGGPVAVSPAGSG
jgi:hypothetical protein